MKHEIDAESLGPAGDEMAKAIETCVHCGFCLSACPTYQLLGQEMDSPRGRIVLMKETLEGNLDSAESAPHIEACLGCLACEPACPSGVRYRDLISPYRGWAQDVSWIEQRKKRSMLRTITSPSRFRWALRVGEIIRPMRRWLPSSIRKKLELIPKRSRRRIKLPEHAPAKGKLRARVALLTGCAQSVLEPEISSAAIDVLTRNGIEVVIPPGQPCCGSLSWHCGDVDHARSLATATMRKFPRDVDAVITTAAGCGTGMQEYGLILKQTEFEEEAAAFADRVCDVSAFLFDIGLSEMPADSGSFEPTLRIAYQDACHLSHGQNVTRAPRELLRQIPGAEILEISQPHICCGSAGTYNLEQPENASKLGEQKIENLLAVKPQVIVSGNIGCIVQLRHHLGQRGVDMPVRHTMQILQDAYRA